MGLFNIFSRRSDINERYSQIRDGIIRKSQMQAAERSVDHFVEAEKIARQCGISKKVRDFSQYKDVATLLLAEYEPELAYYIMVGLNEQFQQKVGYVVIGQVVLAIEHINEFKRGLFIKTEFLQDYSNLFEYTTQSPNRTGKAISILTCSVCSLHDAEMGRKAYGVLTVPEMRQSVKDKLYSLDEVVAKYITK